MQLLQNRVAQLKIKIQILWLFKIYWFFGLSTWALVKLFKNIRRKFRPVLRHFFTEYHKMPQSWFEMRLNYSRSVAVTSIIGHVLGLGDRHISNILLDTVTGEVVHIDLGIAFDQVNRTLSSLFRPDSRFCRASSYPYPSAFRSV